MEVPRFEPLINIILFPQVRNSNFSAFIDVFTANTYVMVIVSDSQIPSEAIMINIRWEWS